MDPTHAREKNRRILVIDDNRAIHEDFRKILAASGASSDLERLDASLFGDDVAFAPEPYEVDSAYQGQTGLAAVNASLAEGRPYALAFVDMRMPPGWDGAETIERLWAVDPNLQVVICSAYSDGSWRDLLAKLGAVDRLLILKKPFDIVEVSQMASALTEKWNLARQAEANVSVLRTMVDDRTRALTAANELLQAEVSQRKTAEQRLRRMASHDTLTGLANRSLLKDRITRCLERSRQRPDYRFALLFLDLDRFKHVNDSLGHVVGDRLLVAIARRLASSLRSHDTVSYVPRNILARIGGDEFVVLLDGIRAPEDAIRVSERLERELCEPFELDGHEVFSTTSIGICMGGPAYETPEALLRDADLALYQAKAAGKARYAVFDSAMHADALARWRMENDLRRGIERGELRVQFQPIVSMDGRELVELEALVRWHHPESGLVSPADFIPLAEDTGLIVPLGYWVIRRVCEQLRAWADRSPLRAIPVAINISARQFAEPNLVDEVRRILEETGVPASWIKLEITETVLMTQTSDSLAVLPRLSELGIKLHLDDFGTGYSSLGYLRRMPIDALKIDRSFVSTMTFDPMSSSIVQAIVTLAHTMDMRVIAEGVETEQQAADLRAIRCDHAQGFLFSRPMDGRDVEALFLPAAEPAAAE